jgi:hypothetical protein
MEVTVRNSPRFTPQLFGALRKRDKKIRDKEIAARWAIAEPR